MKEELKNINFQLTESLRRDIKFYLGTNISYQLRKVLKDMIDKKKGRQDKRLICYMCSETQVNLDDMVILCPEEIKKEVYQQLIICEDCFLEVMTNNLKYYQEELKTRTPTLKHRRFAVSLCVFMLYCKDKEEKIVATRELNDYSSPPLLEIYERMSRYYPHLVSLEVGKFIIKNNKKVNEMMGKLLENYDFAKERWI